MANEGIDEWEDAKWRFQHRPNKQTFERLRRLQPINEEEPDTYILYDVLPELVEGDWANAVKFILDYLDLDPVALRKLDMNINVGNYGEYVGEEYMSALLPPDDAYDTMRVFFNKALEKGHSLNELEHIYEEVEPFYDIKQKYIEYVENERAKLMYLRKANPALPNNIIFRTIQQYTTNQPVFNAQHEARVRRINPSGATLKTNSSNRRNRNNNTANRWAPNIVQRGGPAKYIRRKHTHRKKRPARG